MAGVVLAGGSSRGLATDKRRIEVEGVLLVARACAALRPISDEVLLACRRDDPPDAEILERFDARLVFDRYPHAGPLAGREAALASLLPDEPAVALLRHIV